jgi:hypothetical protein
MKNIFMAITKKTEFWDEYEKVLVENVTNHPYDYGVGPYDSAKDYAHMVRVRFENKSLESEIGHINLSTITFKRVFKAIEPDKKFSQREIVALFERLV